MRTTVGEAAGRKRPPPLASGLAWLDGVLGGGFVPGSVVMVHGPPGAGKSTLALMAAAGVPGSLYCSAEEDAGRVADRAVRLGLRRDLALAEARSAAEALAQADGAPLVVLDSLQALGGRPLQAAQAALDHARRTGACVVLVCHETKAGDHAGPRALEHLVDASLRLGRSPRALVANKNRHGPAGDEVPLAMTRLGLVA